jgi:SAM-dependent methyltransferase
MSEAGVYWRLRHSLARVAFLRSGYYLLRSIREAMEDSPEHGRAELNQEFGAKEDPWDYDGTPNQVDRIRSEVEMIDAVRGTERFKSALEVGCAEGLFTEKLAPFCAHLLAVDISEVALARARKRLGECERVDFAVWDMRTDPVPETYDLIVIVHAMEYVRNPLCIRRVRAKLVNSLRPGGYLLVGTMKVADIYEDAWWGRFLLRSGKQINNFFARHPKLKVVSTAELQVGNDYKAYDVLLKRKP